MSRYDERRDEVAKALCASRYLGAISWESLSPHERTWFREDATAAIRAWELSGVELPK